MKKCTRCEEIKPITEFNKNSSYCKRCKNEYNKQYYYNNKDYYTEYYNNNAEKLKQYNKEYRVNNSEKLKQYREDHKGHFLYLIYKNKAIVYVGSCSHISDRVSSHINLHSNISDFMKLGTWTSIKYYDVSDMVESKNERLFIESILIEELTDSNSWNSRSANNVGLDDDTREEELSQIAFDILNNLEEFITYKTNDNNKAYYIDMDYVEDYSPDIADIVNAYVSDLEEEDYWE